MELVKALDPNAFAYLDDIDKSKWTLSHDDGKRCGILTTNMSECINGVMKHARRLPITTIVRITFLRSVQDFYDRLKDATRVRNIQRLCIREELNEDMPDERTTYASGSGRRIISSPSRRSVSRHAPGEHMASPVAHGQPLVIHHGNCVIR
ncbi:hypothetical protein PHJA_001388300 [Phtheirospermum japonicum]|uniref:Uncharacterized protein n=1 Tax=Phtheirospermum japonicum TaxID=374723 RepID=A0A830CDT1_9LAMI|nr:hypothetical protein PHJA_001388300 [Phtheirospermum japonicum]